MLLRNINILVTMAVALLIEWALCLLDTSLMLFMAGALVAGEALRAGRAFLIQKTSARSRPVLKFLVIELLPYHICLICELLFRDKPALSYIGHPPPPPPPISHSFIAAIFDSMPTYLLLVAAWFFHWFWTKPERKRKEYIYLFGCVAAITIGLFFLSRAFAKVRIFFMFYAGAMLIFPWLSMIFNFSSLYILMERYRKSQPDLIATLKGITWRLVPLCAFIFMVVVGTIWYPWGHSIDYIALPGTPGSGRILLVEVWHFDYQDIDLNNGFQKQAVNWLKKHHTRWRSRSWIYNVKTRTLTPRPWHLNHDDVNLITPVFREQPGTLMVGRYEKPSHPKYPRTSYLGKYTLRIFDSKGTQIKEQTIRFSHPVILAASDESTYLMLETDRQDNTGYSWNSKTGSINHLNHLQDYFITGGGIWTYPVSENHLFFSGFPKEDTAVNGWFALDMNSGNVEQVAPSAGQFDISPDGKAFIIGHICMKCQQNVLPKFLDDQGKALVISMDSKSLLSSFKSDASEIRFHPTKDLLATLEYSDKHEGLSVVIRNRNGALQKKVFLPDKLIKARLSGPLIFQIHWIDDNHILLRGDQSQGLIVNLATGQIQSPREIVRARSRR